MANETNIETAIEARDKSAVLGVLRDGSTFDKFRAIFLLIESGWSDDEFEGAVAALAESGEPSFGSVPLGWQAKAYLTRFCGYSPDGSCAEYVNNLISTYGSTV